MTVNVAMAQIGEASANLRRTGRGGQADVFHHLQGAALELCVGAIGNNQDSQAAIAFFVKRHFNGLGVNFLLESTIAVFSA